MKETNILKILENAPKGIVLYSPIFGYGKLKETTKNNIIINSNYEFCFDRFGKINDEEDGECILFPSKECQTWENWQKVIIPNCPVGTVLSITTEIPNYYWIVLKNGFLCVPKFLNSSPMEFSFDKMEYDNLCFAMQIEQTACFEHLKKLGYEFVNGEIKKIEKQKENISDKWNIFNAKDGDFIIDEVDDAMFIFKEISDGKIQRHVVMDNDGFIRTKIEDPSGFYDYANKNDNYRLATEKEKEYFLQKLAKRNLNWNEEKKILNFNLKTFDRVLVKDNFNPWRIELFSHYDNDASFPFICLNNSYLKCIPYNNTTKYLLGTTEEYEGVYKTW